MGTKGMPTVCCTMDTQSMLMAQLAPGSSPEAPMGTKSMSTVPYLDTQSMLMAC
jgi:hypothetical protein